MHRTPCTIAASVLLFFCASCKNSTPAPPAPKPQPHSPALKAAPATPIAEKKGELGGKTWNPAWDALVEKALPPDMLSVRAARAVASFCPRFAAEPEADKRAFWAYTFQALAGAEAGLDPVTTVRHSQAAVTRVDRVTHQPVRQQGLLQLTYDDNLRYGCDFNWPHDRRLALDDPRRSILNPARNLRCGIRILHNQILRQGKPLVSRASYWSTLQPGTHSYTVFAAQMANVPAACGVGRELSRVRHRRTAAHRSARH